MFSNYKLHHSITKNNITKNNITKNNITKNNITKNNITKNKMNAENWIKLNYRLSVLTILILWLQLKILDLIFLLIQKLDIKSRIIPNAVYCQKKKLYIFSNRECSSCNCVIYIAWFCTI